MIKKISMIPIIIITLLFSACDFLSNDYRYEDKENAFIFNYKDPWKSLERDDGLFNIVLEGKADENESQKILVEVTTKVEPLQKEGMTLDDAAQLYSQGLVDGYVTQKNILMDDVKGYWLTVKPLNEEEAVDKSKKDVAFIIKDNKVYLFYITVYRPNLYDEYVGKIDGALAGFEFID